MRQFFHTRIRNALLQQLQAGITPHRLATSFAVGALVGTFPVLASTTLLSLACGFVFRLNHVAVQVAKELTYPLQLLLLIPLLTAGGKLLGAPVPASLAALQLQFRAGAWATLQIFARAPGGAIVLWLLAGVPLMLLLAMALRPVLARFSAQPGIAPAVPE